MDVTFFVEVREMRELLFENQHHVSFSCYKHIKKHKYTLQFHTRRNQNGALIQF